MILFIILSTIILLLVLFTVVISSIGGAIGIILFSDVIVCIALLVFIMCKIFKRKK